MIWTNKIMNQKSDFQEREVQWYRVNGVCDGRIKLDANGRLYVIGDWSWNKNHYPRSETIEHRMRIEGVYNQNPL